MERLTREQNELQNAINNCNDQNAIVNNKRIVELLENGGCDPNFEFKLFDGWVFDVCDGFHWIWTTPLLCASYYGDITADTLGVLIDHGADIHATNSDGRSALHRASSREKFFLLIDAGADPHKKDGNGKSAIDKKEEESAYNPQWSGIRAEVPRHQAGIYKKKAGIRQMEETKKEIKELERLKAAMEEETKQMKKTLEDTNVAMENMRIELEAVKADRDRRQEATHLAEESVEPESDRLQSAMQEEAEQMKKTLEEHAAEMRRIKTEVGRTAIEIVNLKGLVENERQTVAEEVRIAKETMQQMGFELEAVKSKPEKGGVLSPLVREAELEAKRIINEAELEVKRLVGAAEFEAELGAKRTIAAAELEAERLVGVAQLEVELGAKRTIAEAELEAKRLVGTMLLSRKGQPFETA